MAYHCEYAPTSLKAGRQPASTMKTTALRMASPRTPGASLKSMRVCAGITCPRPARSVSVRWCLVLALNGQKFKLTVVRLFAIMEQTSNVTNPHTRRISDEFTIPRIQCRSGRTLSAVRDGWKVQQELLLRNEGHPADTAAKTAEEVAIQYVKNLQTNGTDNTLANPLPRYMPPRSAFCVGWGFFCSKGEPS